MAASGGHEAQPVDVVMGGAGGYDLADGRAVLDGVREDVGEGDERCASIEELERVEGLPLVVQVGHAAG
ncbi:MAG: hypothetical protein BRD40_02615, partial [Bacteroidetes bacterium QS_1_65_9]